MSHYFFGWQLCNIALFVLTVNDVVTFVWFVVGVPQSLVVLVKSKIIRQPFAQVRLLQPSEALGPVWTLMVFRNSQHDQHGKQYHQQTQNLHGDVCGQHRASKYAYNYHKNLLVQWLLTGIPWKVANNENPIQTSTWKFSKTATKRKHCRTSHQESFMLLPLRSAKYINPCSLGQSPKSSDNVSPQSTMGS